MESGGQPQVTFLRNCPPGLLFLFFDNTIFLLLDSWILECRTQKEDCVSNEAVEGLVNGWLGLVGKVLNRASWR